jgi:very-short-patch-repair endonuclease
MPHPRHDTLWEPLRRDPRHDGVHDRDEVVPRDHLRQTEIEALGWTVVRFTNETALAEPWRLDEAIRDRARVLGLL